MALCSERSRLDRITDVLEHVRRVDELRRSASEERQSLGQPGGHPRHIYGRVHIDPAGEQNRAASKMQPQVAFFSGSPYGIAVPVEGEPLEAAIGQPTSSDYTPQELVRGKRHMSLLHPTPRRSSNV